VVKVAATVAIHVPTGAAFPLRVQAALSQQPPPENNVRENCDRTLVKL
jgi:hypothetical protein